MNSWLANISVNIKLALGFGLVLVLTAILALISWTSLDGLIDRSDRMSSISALSNQLANLRVSRLQYMIANGDETVGQTVQVAIDGYKSQQQKLRTMLSSAEDAKLLTQLSDVSNNYESALVKMRNAYTVSSHVRAQMGIDAVKGADIIGAIITAVLQMAPTDEGRFVQYQAIMKAKEDLALVRYEVRGYTANVTANTEQKAMNQLQSTIGGLKPLGEVFGSSQPEKLKQLETALLNYRTSVQAFKVANGDIVSSRKSLGELGAAILSLNDELYKLQTRLRDQDSARSRTLQIGATLLALIIGTLAAVIITRQITLPLQQTLTVIERIASGDLSHSPAVTRRDELGMLQQGTQRMGSTLRALIRGIHEGVTQIASAADALSAATQQTSAGVNSQKIETDQVATAMHEMSATVQEVARSAEQASNAASAADKQAREGDKVVGEAIVQIERLAAEVVRSSEAMNGLQLESNKIGKVMDVIKAVAEQTNLLALNAAIEAARAGEAGRGFAVVADEVRGLAQRTQKSTEEIEALVAGLQHGTQQVSSIMLSSRNLTDSSVALTRQAGASLESITQTVSSIQAMNQQIAAAAEQQSAVADEISRSIINVRDASEQTAAASGETAASSVELARLGTQLQTLVSRFRM
ncbi:methyl-accepting chemotaxis protein [Pseudomonas sp. CCC3.2]|uniref:HAMP domain-containing methyl-accepting chemotaxis protein n=3 Tax=unclassified Pseudomonas TaxID=196821 RepID=UPI002AB57DA1|nr:MULTISPECIES: methyl-accepting chemotaxis protein [unclassified Pseudomonas]MDY7559756.1 methyl-accepting chemotaxis protein [Pseudomonas sp. AB6]MEB0178535.1 methyl-accepting chemotaxis protein [Pseudomonas sp. CCC3.2]MEB0209887.1 methyl-accepting chemotaxis protein [Pseudomonas sp. AB6]